MIGNGGGGGLVAFFMERIVFSVLASYCGHFFLDSLRSMQQSMLVLILVSQNYLKSLLFILLCLIA